MLDLKFIRENADLVKEAIKNKNEKADIDRILELDEAKRIAQFNFDQKKADQNRVSKEIGLKKKNKEDASDLLAQMGNVAQEIKDLKNILTDAENALNEAILWVPNMPHPDVPVGKSEDDNQILREWGTKREFTFQALDHVEIAEKNGLLDLERGAKISGSGFPIHTGMGARLERALINFMLDYHLIHHGYQEIMVPSMVNPTAMQGTGQLPKLKDDMYRISEDDMYLIPTAEVPITNFYAGEILKNDDLPKKFVGFSNCFRREAGSYGKDTRGLQRLHQFNKVEMVRFVQPEDSWQVLEEMVNDAEDILKALNLPYRVLRLCTGDTSFASAMTYDLEVWAPGANKYLEVSSVSNFVDFQARRASIRFRDNEGKVQFVHTLNGSGLATPRTIIAILENYQNEDGSFDIPEALKHYLPKI
ncbi:serine--tRNA ligase [bacterium]|nr:serine--tRNA ligase [bacterium]